MILCKYSHEGMLFAPSWVALKAMHVFGCDSVSLELQILRVRLLGWWILRLADPIVGSCSEASYLKRNSAMDDSIGGS